VRIGSGTNIFGVTRAINPIHEMISLEFHRIVNVLFHKESNCAFGAAKGAIYIKVTLDFILRYITRRILKGESTPKTG